MMAIDLLLLDVSRVQPVADPTAHPQAAVHWQFSPQTGPPHWLKRAQALDLNPLAKVENLEGTGTAPQHRRRTARDAGSAGQCRNGLSLPPTPLAFEPGGSTAAPKRVIVLPDGDEPFVARYAAAPPAEPALIDLPSMHVRPVPTIACEPPPKDWP
jgi:hypothetical protein